MKKQKIRLKLSSNDHFQLDKAVKEIVRTVKKTGSRIYGPVPLPTNDTIFTVLRSPNNDKKSREQYQYSVHKRLIDIEIPLSGSQIEETMNELMKLQIASVVSVKIEN
jgi:small subunit ribosomal protein S10